MNRDHQAEIARRIVVTGKGILAANQNLGTIEKCLDVALGTEFTKAGHRQANTLSMFHQDAVFTAPTN